MFYVYVLESECRVGFRYIGFSGDLKNRLRDHNEGKCRYTRKYRPWRVVYFEVFACEKGARKREQQIKKWSAGKKDTLIRGDFELLKGLSRRKR
jgi:putative endonuclease